MANEIDPHLRDTWEALLDFYRISCRFNPDSPIFRNNILIVMTHTIKNSQNRVRLVEACFNQEALDLINLGLTCLEAEDVDRFKERLMPLMEIKGIHTTVILDLLKDKYPEEARSLAGKMLGDETVSAFIKGRIIIDLKGLPYKEVKAFIKAYLASENPALKSAALNLLGHYINEQDAAFQALQADITARYNPLLFSAYRKITRMLSPQRFEQLAASWHRLAPPVQDMMTVTAQFSPDKRDVLNRILNHAGALNEKLWFNILNGLIPGVKTEEKQQILCLISIDTLRSDHLNIYGYGRQTMPCLAEIVRKRGVVFNQVYANTSWTLPSHVSMLSGLSPLEHQVNDIQDRIRPDTAYFPQFLKNQGFFTAAFVTSTLVSQQHDFHRGFDFFYYNQEEKAGDIMSKAGITLRTLSNAEKNRPVFLFIHLYDCHNPYAPEKAFDVFHDSPPFAVPGNAYINGQQNLYDGEILYVDRIIGDFIHHLDPAFDATFLITSDHGEEFLDHHGVHHGTTLYNEVLRVPFMMIWSAEHPHELKADRNAAFSLQDTPFMLSGLLGLNYQAGASDAGKQGIELLLHRDELHQIGLIREQAKVIYDLSGHRFEAYHLLRDPREKNPLDADQFSDIVDDLKQRAEALLSRSGEVEGIYDEDMTERLRVLGYIH